MITYSFLVSCSYPFCLPRLHFIAPSSCKHSLHRLFKHLSFLLQICHTAQIGDIIGVLDVNSRATLRQLLWNLLRASLCSLLLFHRLRLVAIVCRHQRSWMHFIWKWLRLRLLLNWLRLLLNLPTLPRSLQMSLIWRWSLLRLLATNSRAFCILHSFKRFKGTNDRAHFKLCAFDLLKFFCTRCLVDHD